MDPYSWNPEQDPAPAVNPDAGFLATKIFEVCILGTGTRFLISKFLITKFLITLFLITVFLT